MKNSRFKVTFSVGTNGRKSRMDRKTSSPRISSGETLMQIVSPDFQKNTAQNSPNTTLQAKILFFGRGSLAPPQTLPGGPTHRTNEAFGPVSVSARIPTSFTPLGTQPSVDAHFQSLHRSSGTHCHLTSNHPRLCPSSVNV